MSDLVTKKPVVVKINDASQLRKLPAAMAQRIAARMKGLREMRPQRVSHRAVAAPSGGAAGVRDRSGRREVRLSNSGVGILRVRALVAVEPAAGRVVKVAGRCGRARRRLAASDRRVCRRPRLPDLQKGDAVMIVATAGDGMGTPGSVVAITLLAGVEPILQASPTGESILTPWSMSGAPGGDAAAQ